MICPDCGNDEREKACYRCHDRMVLRSLHDLAARLSGPPPPQFDYPEGIRERILWACQDEIKRLERAGVTA